MLIVNFVPLFKIQYEFVTPLTSLVIVKPDTPIEEVPFYPLEYDNNFRKRLVSQIGSLKSKKHYMAIHQLLSKDKVKFTKNYVSKITLQSPVLAVFLTYKRYKSHILFD